MRGFVTWLALVAALPSALAAQRFEPSEAEIAFMRDLLNRYQHASFRHDVEYCGYVLRDENGELFATPSARGDRTSCTLPDPKRAGDIVASWHTHAAFNPDAHSEVPSLQDIDSDIRAGIHGWVSTPGGRFWLVDHLAEEVRLICGPSCLVTDPDHVFGFEGQIPTQISREELADWGQ